MQIYKRLQDFEYSNGFLYEFSILFYNFIYRNLPNICILRETIICIVWANDPLTWCGV